MKKRIVSLMAAVCLLFTVVLSGCGGKPTLEDYFKRITGGEGIA